MSSAGAAGASSYLPWRVLVFDFHFTLINRMVLVETEQGLMQPVWLRQQFYSYADWLLDFLVKARQRHLFIAVATSTESRFDGLSMEQIRAIQTSERQQKRVVAEDELEATRDRATYVGGKRLVTRYMDALFGGNAELRRQILPDDLIVLHDWAPFSDLGKHRHMLVIEDVLRRGYGWEGSRKQMVLFDDSQKNVDSVVEDFDAVKVAQADGFSLASWAIMLRYEPRFQLTELQELLYGSRDPDAAATQIRYEVRFSDGAVVDRQRGEAVVMDFLDGSSAGASASADEDSPGGSPRMPSAFSINSRHITMFPHSGDKLAYVIPTACLSQTLGQMQLHCSLLGLQLERSVLLNVHDWETLCGDASGTCAALLDPICNVERVTGDRPLTNALQRLVQSMIQYPQPSQTNLHGEVFAENFTTAEGVLRTNCLFLGTWVASNCNDHAERVACTKLLNRAVLHWGQLVKTRHALNSESSACDPVCCLHGNRLRMTFERIGALCDGIIARRIKCDY